MRVHATILALPARHHRGPGLPGNSTPLPGVLAEATLEGNDADGLAYLACERLLRSCDPLRMWPMKALNIDSLF
jgi:hypothetical protein